MNRVFKLLIATLSLATGSLWLNTAHAASFDCAKARTKIEKLICADPLISKLDSQLGKVYDKDIAKADPKQKKRLVTEERDWLKGMRDRCTTQACLKRAYMQRLAALKAFDRPHSPKRKILGRYTAQRVPLSASVFVPIASGCRTLAANFNQFRNVPFASKNPRLSPKYPQFRRPHWTPMAWNPKLAQRVGGMGPCRANDRSCEAVWHWWLKKTKPLREAGKALLWRTSVDLLGNGQHETIIRLDHILPYTYVRGRFVPEAIPPYSPYLDDKLYMLPSSKPQVAKAFNNLFTWGWQIGRKQGVFSWPTDLIKNTHDKKHPYYVLTWLRVGHRGDGVIGMGFIRRRIFPFPGYMSYPLCTIKWIAKHGRYAQ